MFFRVALKMRFFENGKNRFCIAPLKSSFLDTEKIAFCGALTKRFLGKRKDENEKNDFFFRHEKAIFRIKKK